MSTARLQLITLLVSGLIAMGIGGAILFMPESFYASNGISLNGHAGLLNEVRASGAAVLACGVLAVSGAFAGSLTLTALIVSAVLYLSYGLSRLVSMALYGLPAEGLIYAAALELLVGALAAFTLRRHLRDVRTPAALSSAT